jgi:hypothetical protein
MRTIKFPCGNEEQEGKFICICGDGIGYAGSPAGGIITGTKNSPFLRNFNQFMVYVETDSTGEVTLQLNSGDVYCFEGDDNVSDENTNEFTFTFGSNHLCGTTMLHFRQNSKKKKKTPELYRLSVNSFKTKAYKATGVNCFDRTEVQDGVKFIHRFVMYIISLMAYSCLHSIRLNNKFSFI